MTDHETDRARAMTGSAARAGPGRSVLILSSSSRLFLVSLVLLISSIIDWRGAGGLATVDLSLYPSKTLPIPRRLRLFAYRAWFKRWKEESKKAGRDG